MKRPIELTIALIVLCAEYFALLPMYFSIGGVPLIGFLIFRPPVLYLLWRGTSWVRTLFIWAIPIVSVVGFVRAWTKYTGAAVGGQTDAPVGPQDVWENLYNAVQASSFSMWVGAVGFFAWLVLYLPRVRAWFQYMKESRKKPPDKNSWLQPINASAIRELGKALACLICGCVGGLGLGVSIENVKIGAGVALCLLVLGFISCAIFVIRAFNVWKYWRETP